MSLELITVDDIIRNNYSPKFNSIPPPIYHAPTEVSAQYGSRIGLAVESMRQHTTDEGWQLFVSLHEAGYTLAGHGLATNSRLDSHTRCNLADVPEILSFVDPSVLVLQDKREWDFAPTDFRDPKARFNNVSVLKKRHNIFKLTVLKDAHQRPGYHAESAIEIGCHAWVTYYHPKIVKHLAPYVREEHLVRTYHTVDASVVPAYTEVGRNGVLLSGAVSGAYPLRTRLVNEAKRLPQTEVLKHPGYHRHGCMTPSFLHTLAQYKVAICTASVFGYALRKIVEATACGCMVLTDLPVDDSLPYIDGNLERIHPLTTTNVVVERLKEMLGNYDPIRQQRYAQLACDYYDYRAMGKRLANDIENLRSAYP